MEPLRRGSAATGLYAVRRLLLSMVVLAMLPPIGLRIVLAGQSLRLVGRRFGVAAPAAADRGGGGIALAAANAGCAPLISADDDALPERQFGDRPGAFEALEARRCTALDGRGRSVASSRRSRRRRRWRGAGGLRRGRSMGASGPAAAGCAGRSGPLRGEARHRRDPRRRLVARESGAGPGPARRTRRRPGLETPQLDDDRRPALCVAEQRRRLSVSTIDTAAPHASVSGPKGGVASPGSFP